jgi:hypothetical protein
LAVAPWSLEHQEDDAVTVRSRFLWAAVLGVGIGAPLWGQEPARFAAEGGSAPSARLALSANQKVANTIAEQLRQSGQLRSYRIDVIFQDGTAELTGTVADQPQREEALRLVQGVPGVERVRDHLQLASITNGVIAQAQAVAPPPKAEPLPPPALEKTPPVELGPSPKRSGDGGPLEPMPIFQAPAPGPYDVNQPKMPPYAWPTYAPYNNYSRVAYPTLYPYNSWPFIGPCYPFPKIPLGWRSVSLKWQDGWWWYAKHGSSHDWWRLRYW